MDKTAYHPNGESITFVEGPHTYIDNSGMRYTSATTFVGQYFPKFDIDTVAEKCANGNNPDYSKYQCAAEIKAAWEAEGERGRNEGSNVHEYAEGLIDSWPKVKLPEPISDRCGLIFNQVEKAVHTLQYYYTFIGAEIIVFSPALGLAGMIDLLMHDPADDTLLILDWKQNKNAFSTENIYQSGLGPINHLQDTDINHYTLQLSLYEYILKREQYFPYIKNYKRGLIHLFPERYEFVSLEYYEYEIEEMLKYVSRIR